MDPWGVEAFEGPESGTTRGRLHLHGKRHGWQLSETCLPEKVQEGDEGLEGQIHKNKDSGSQSLKVWDSRTLNLV